MLVDPDNQLVFVLAVVVGVLAVARAVRLVVDDTFPPVETLKGWWLERAPVKWHPILECPWCFAPYVAAPAVVWFATLIAWPHWSANHWVWWIVNGWAAVAWTAAFVSMRDVPPEQRE